MNDVVSPRAAWREGVARHLRLFLLCAAVCIAVALVEGKDFNWDLRNYHLYAPWALLHSRFDVDFMAGGPQGYLNPLAYLPLYWMAKSGMNDKLVVAMLAAIHAFCLFFTCLIANRLFTGRAPRERRLLVAASAFIALLSPVFWGVLGSTFADPIVAAFLLASLYFAMRADEGRRGMWLVSGFAFGTGLALKLTLLLFAPALAAAVAAGAHWRQPWRLLWWPLGALGGAMLAGGASAVALYHSYGSPTFPIFNGIFRSAFAGTAPSAAHQRFIPDTALEFLIRPLRMLDAHSWVYIENSAPDARFLALFALALIAVVWLCCRRILHRREQVVASTGGQPVRRSILQFWMFFLAAWISWLLASGNGRYAIALFLLVGPAIVLLLRWLLPTRGMVYFVVGLCGIQVFLLMSSFEHRWTRAEWLGKWVQVESTPIDRQANGYVLIDINTNSIAFPFLSQDSAYFALAGQMQQADLPAVAQRFAEFEQRWHGRLRLIVGMSSPDLIPDRIQRNKLSLLALHGLRPVDATTHTCSRITIRGDRTGGRMTTQVLLSCPLETVPPDMHLRARQQEMKALFDRVAATCRLWFPSGDDAMPLPRAAGWEKRYEPTDVTLFSSGNNIFLSRGDFGPFDVPLGSVTDWSANRAKRPDCRPLPRHYQSDGVSFLK